jgi:hypothetical protein
LKIGGFQEPVLDLDLRGRLGDLGEFVTSTGNTP